MPTDLVIMGAGDMAREIASLVRVLNQRRQVWNLRGFLVEDDSSAPTVVDGYPVILGIQTLSRQAYSGAIAIGTANVSVSARIEQQIRDAGLRVSFPSLVHPSAVMDTETVGLEEGVIVFAGSVLTNNVRLGRFTFVNNLCSIGHDSRVGAFCRVMPTAAILGSVNLGEGVLIGAGAVIKEYVEIGERAQVAMGAVVGANVDPWTVVAGNPGRVIMKVEAS